MLEFRKLELEKYEEVCFALPIRDLEKLDSLFQCILYMRQLVRCIINLIEAVELIGFAYR
jgi:hypothetical protein